MRCQADKPLPILLDGAVTEIWVTLKLARSCASRLDRLDELDGLLEWRSRSAWTVEDKEEGGLVSNWKIGSDRVDPAQYSTAAMLSTTFLRVHILPSGTQVRTFVPPEFAQAAPSATPAPFLAPGFKDLHRRLVEWTTREWEDWLEGDEEDEYGRRTASGAPTNGAEPDLAGASFFSAGLSLLGLINGLPPDAFGHAPPGSAVLIAPADRFPEKPSTAALTGSDLLRISSPPLGLVEVPTELELGRHELLAGSAKARLALVDFMSRLTAREWTRSLEAELAGPSEVAVVAAAAAVEAFSLSGGVSAEAFEALAARVEALESAVVVQALEQASAPPKIPAERGIDPAEALREENTMLRLRVREMEEARAAKVGVTQAKRPELMAHVPVIVVLAGAVWWWHRSHGT